MAFKTFVAGDVLTASEVNTYLMKQAVITCTSATRPTPVAGMVIYETDTNRLQVYNGSAWVPESVPKATYTPTLTSIVVGSGGTNTAQYYVNRGVMHIQGNIIFGTSGQTFPSGSVIGASLPSGFTFDGVDASIVGLCRMRDSSVPQNYRGNCQWVSASSTISFNIDNVAGTYPTLATPSATIPFAAAWASGDSIEWSVTLPVT